MRSTTRFVLALALGLPGALGCGRKEQATSDVAASATSAASPVPPPTSSQPSARSAAPPASSAPKPVVERSYRAYQGKIGTADLRLALEISGTRVEGVFTRGGEEGALAGEMKDARHFFVREAAPRGKKGATFEGSMEGERLSGSWKEPGEKRARPARGERNRPFGAADATFEEAYLGSLGAKIRIRMRLRREGDRITGRYRYMKSKEDLKVEGTVSAATGELTLLESTQAGKETGRFKGVFLDKGFAFGRWSSPDGARSYPFTLRRGDVYPNAVTLPGGVIVQQKEEHHDRGPHCTVSVIHPEVLGGAGEKALNRALRQAADGGKLDCALASEESRFESDTTYRVGATRKDRFALAYSFYQYAGGVHGMHTEACFVADVEKGTLTRSEGRLLPVEARKKLAALVNAALRKEHGVGALTEAGFSADELAIEDGTAICVEGQKLVVVYQPYEVAPYVMGSPRVEIEKTDAGPLVAGTALEVFYR